MDPDASELDYDSEEGDFDAEELEGMDEDEQNEFSSVTQYTMLTLN